MGGGRLWRVWSQVEIASRVDRMESEPRMAIGQQFPCGDSHCFRWFSAMVITCNGPFDQLPYAVDSRAMC